MSTCSECGGTRENNIMRHREGCGLYRATDRAANEARLGRAPDISVHPDLVELDANLTYWFGEETG